MSLEQTIGNLEIRYANVVTFVGSSNTMVDTTTGRIQTKGIQHNSNVITDVSGPHGRIAPTLKKYPEIAFADGKFDSNESTNTYVQAGYTVTDSSHHNEYYGAWIFDDQTSFVTNKNLWISPINTYTTSGGAGTPTMTVSDAQCTSVDGVATPGEWVQLKLPNKVKLSSISIMGPTDGNQSSSDLGRSPKDAVLAGSVDGTTWNSVLTWSGVTDWVVKVYKSFPANVDSTNYYNYFRLIVTKNDGTHVYASIQELQLYGYEEDPPVGDHSVDTTFKSRFNNPQLTGVQVLVDGATGVGTNQISGGADPSGNNSTYDATNKYYTLNGTLTSNLSVEANTFLEGDQPHAVSVWFNSSNLEANVSNTCVFSIASEEKLNSQNLDLQSNTWHNLTYTYQGEGGSKVTYLDGRKVVEDQAEDTFGEYPSFAMTGYSQDGYVVSSSGGQGITGSAGYGASKAVWKIFMDGSTSGNVDEWVSAYDLDAGGAGPIYNTGSGDTAYTYGTGRNNSIGSVRGEWIKIEYPKKIVVSSIDLTADHTWSSEAVRRYTVLGSDDDLNWTVIRNVQSGDGNNRSLAASTAPSTGLVMNGLVNASRGYTYIGIVITQLQNYDHYARIPRMRIYGRVENDLVRLPDPTNVLKYPHIAMTGSAQRGYVASVSSLFNDGSTSSYQAWKPFDGSIANDVGGWLSDNSPVTYSTSSPYNATSATGNSLSGITGGVGSRLGAWLKLELPHKIKFSEARLYGRNAATTERIDAGYIYGSNDDTNWTQIGEISVSGISSGNLSTYTDIVPLVISSTDTTNSYKYFIVQPTSLTHAYGYAGIGQMEYFGTGVDSIPIQIGGGNIDKVANFRVYDKFIGEDQVNEIWNAQKEEFGRAKPQMVFQQGKLGIGTNAPQGSLSVADEPHFPEEFPPGAMTDNNTHFAGHGTFKATSEWTRDSAYEPFAVFNKYTHDTNVVGSQDRMWWSSINAFTGNPGVFNGDATKNIGGYTGVGLKIEMPYSILCNRIDLYPRNPYGYPQYTQNPRAFKFIASKDNEFWDLLHEETNFVDRGGTAHPFHISTTQYYKYFAIVVTGVGNSTLVSIVDLQFFGTREQGQSVLHDGQLTLTKSLYCPGVPVQIVSKVYKKQVAYGSTNSDRNIKELDISIKPKFANSRILLHWMINGELHQDVVIRVARDGSYIIHGYNETQGTNQWSGVACGGYDLNEDSTPENYCIDTYDEPGGTNTYNYQIYIGSSSTGSYPAYINRTYISGASNAHEAGICFMSATEIAQ